jgi:hypothetical protein
MRNKAIAGSSGYRRRIRWLIGHPARILPSAETSLRVQPWLSSWELPGEDLLAEAVERQRTGRDFSGLIYVHQKRLSDGDCIGQLELIAKACDPEELRGRILFLPLR